VTTAAYAPQPAAGNVTNVEFADALDGAKQDAAALLVAVERFTELYPCVMANGLWQLASGSRRLQTTMRGSAEQAAPSGDGASRAE
jgi:hypothetical protein